MFRRTEKCVSSSENILYLKYITKIVIFVKFFIFYAISTNIYVKVTFILFAGVIPPLTVLDEKNGISVVLHFAKDRPRPDVSVLVVTTLSKNQFPISNYQFQAVIPKVSLKVALCK